MFSRTKATVRHVIRSVIRDCAVWMIGALWPSSRPATTTEITPEACTSSAATKAANGVRNEIAVSISGSVIRLRSQATSTKNGEADRAAPPPAARTKSMPTSASATPPERAAMAVRSATRAVASLSSDSPSRIVTTRRGRPIRRATAVAATASGGATDRADRDGRRPADAGHQPLHDRRRPPATVSTTSTTESRRIEPRLALKSTSEVWIAAA